MESTTRLITIPNYSKLLPSCSRKTLDEFHFRGHVWSGLLFSETEYLIFGVSIDDVPRRQGSRSASGTKIYIEILDESGKHTVFDREQTLGNDTWQVKGLLFRRSELEASSCIRNDSVTVRCTLSLHTRSFSKPTMCTLSLLTRRFFKPTMTFEEPKVVLAGCHTLTIDNFSKHKAALKFLRCARSTRFSVGGATWYFKLYPNGDYIFGEDYSMHMSLLLTRVSSDEPATTVEFNFELLAGDDGGKYHESTKVRRTFDRASPEHGQLVPSTSTPKHDRIIVRCRLAVIKAEMPMPRSKPVLTPLSSDEPATTAEFNFDPHSESLLTPLLGCHDVRSA